MRRHCKPSQIHQKGQAGLSGDCFELWGEPSGCDPKSPPITSAMTASTIAPVSCRVILVDLLGFAAPLRGLGGRPPPFLGLGGRPLGSGEPERCLGCRVSPLHASERGLEGRAASMLGVCWLLPSRLSSDAKLSACDAPAANCRLTRTAYAPPATGGCSCTHLLALHKCIPMVGSTMQATFMLGGLHVQAWCRWMVDTA